MVSVVDVLANARQYSAPIFGDFTHIGNVPFPTSSRESSLTAVVSRAEVTETTSGLSLWAPQNIIKTSLSNGEFLELLAVKPRDFGTDDPLDEPIGQMPHLAEQREKQYQLNLMKFYQVYDKLLFCFFDKTKQDEKQKFVAAFLEHYEKIAEEAFVPYYNSLGKKFFAWLNA